MRWWRPGDGIEDALTRESDVHKGSNGVDVTGVLSTINKVTLAGLIFRVPLKDVKLRAQKSASLSKATGWGRGDQT